MSSHRLIVTASIGRTWNRHGEASVRHWAKRVGADFFIRNEPYEIDGAVVHPWHAKWDMVADAVEACRPEELVWIDDDIVVRADAEWPEYEAWAALEVAEGRSFRGDPREQGGLEISRITGIPWTSESGYYNSGLVFRREPNAPEFRELGRLSRKVPPRLMASQAPFAVHLSVQSGVTRLPPEWHVRGPELRDGCLPGFVNHFLGGQWDLMHEIGGLWTVVPGRKREWSPPRVRLRP